MFKKQWITPEFLATNSGRYVASAGMFLLLLFRYYDEPPRAFCFFLAALLVAYLPSKRMALFLIGTVILSIAFPSSFSTVWYLVPLYFLVGLVFLLLAKKIGRRGFFAHPVLGFSTLTLCLASLSYLPFLPSFVREGSLRLSLILASLFGYALYAIQNVTGKKPGSLWQNLAFFNSFWGSSHNPIGKGLTYSRKFEAKNRLELAECQLSALKLMFWIIFFLLCLKILEYFGHLLTIPTRIEELKHFKNPLETASPMNRRLSWAALILNFSEMMLKITIEGNSFVAVAHFSGFRIPKNTIAPLTSVSIADFWNRFQFYFKEFLVDFFFIPAFRKLTFVSEKSRIFIATLIAAGFGNYLFHCAMHFAIVPDYGLGAFLIASIPYAIYCFILAFGIGISQLLTPLGARPAGFRPHICLSVLGFYALLQVFDLMPFIILNDFKGNFPLLLPFYYCFYLFGGSPSFPIS